MPRDAEEKKASIPQREEEMIRFWEERGIFEKTLAKNKGRQTFVFYEGPPTANAAPAIHHLEARAFKDVIPRYKTMAGFFVPRQAGWDTHGLPVEIQIEKKLGLKNKQDIEKLGIAEFNRQAKESVWQYKEDWEKFTRRIGYWLDLAHPYITYDSAYMESLWAIIKQFWTKKYLYEDFKVVPWCTRCGTALSSHEVGQGYQEVTDTAVFVKFKVKSLKFNVAAQSEKLTKVLAEGKPVYILAWTTTPWTLPGNVALAINPKLDYLLIDHISELYIVAKDALGKGIRFDALAELVPDFANVLTGEKKLSDSHYLEGMIKGSELLNFSYEPLFRIPSLAHDNAYKIYPADFVTAEEGTGVVHTAVMYGEDDYQLGKKVGLPAVHTVTEAGKFTDEVGPELAGKYVKAKETENEILRILGDRVFTKESYTHEYPHCWRCATSLLYYARKAWWVRVTAVKQNLLNNNKVIEWVPSHLKNGRFGEFLKDVRDWAFSRERYWGTPLPVWRCEKCSHTEVLGSRKELAGKGGKARNNYFVMRHGESEANVRDITGSRDGKYPLTAKGRLQAEKAAAGLKRHKIDIIIASPVKRTRETAEIIAKKLKKEVSTDKRLMEIDAGIFTDRPGVDYLAHFSSDLEKFTKRPPEGESLADVRSRMLAVVEELECKHKGKNIVLVSHEYPIWALVGGAAGLTDAETVALRKGKRGKGCITFAEVLPFEYIRVPRDERGEINLHRPYVDTFVFPCVKCKAEMRRIPEVADVWFDSGAMPFAAPHWPFDHKNDLAFPAEFIAEAVDQTRGWFYTLLAVATLLGRKAPYKNVISLGHVLDKNGLKMSKSKGNVISPAEMIEKYGADALRWYFYTINSPGDPKRFDEKDVATKMRGFLMTFWNSFLLFDTYVDKIQNPKFQIPNKSQILNSKHILDRWILAKLNLLVGWVTAGLNEYDIMGAARAIDEFTINDFSQWFVRRSRKRFQHPESIEEKDEAATTMARVLLVLTELSAPFTPFMSEAVYQELRKKMELREESVHLRQWPNWEERMGVLALDLDRKMSKTRTIVAKALKLRADAGIRVRQPLALLTITDRALVEQPELLALIRDEVNVKQVIFGPEEGLDTVITPALKEEGFRRDLVRTIQEMRKDLGLAPRDNIRIAIEADAGLMEIVEKNRAQILKDTNASALAPAHNFKSHIMRESAYEGKKLVVHIAR